MTTVEQNTISVIYELRSGGMKSTQMMKVMMSTVMILMMKLKQSLKKSNALSVINVIPLLVSSTACSRI